jgi:hypothetical protein
MLATFSKNNPTMLIFAGMILCSDMSKKSYNRALVYWGGKSYHFNKASIIESGPFGGPIAHNEKDLMATGGHTPHYGGVDSSGAIIEGIADELTCMARVCADQSLLGGKSQKCDILLIAGPGFGAPVGLANYKCIVHCDGESWSNIYFGNQKFVIKNKGYNCFDVDINNRTVSNISKRPKEIGTADDDMADAMSFLFGDR